MNDTNTYEVHPEIAKMIPGAQNNPPEQPEPEQIPQEAPTQAQPEVQPSFESDAARNFRAIREAKERAERERDELYNRLKQIETRQAPTQEDDINLRPDDLVEWRHVEKKMRTLENQIKQNYQQTIEQTVESRLKAQYADFDSVVNAQNIETLRVTHPEVAETISANPNLYSKAVSAYTLIKKLGIIADPEIKRDVQRAQQNAAKPKPLASINPQQGESPLSHANAFANGLNDDLKKQLHKEMMAAMKER